MIGHIELGEKERIRGRMQKWNDVNTHNEINKLKNCISSQHTAPTQDVKKREKEKKEFRIINNSVYIIEGAKANIGECTREDKYEKKK